MSRSKPGPLDPSAHGPQRSTISHGSLRSGKARAYDPCLNPSARLECHLATASNHARLASTTHVRGKPRKTKGTFTKLYGYNRPPYPGMIDSPPRLRGHARGLRGAGPLSSQVPGWRVRLGPGKFRGQLMIPWLLGEADPWPYRGLLCARPLATACHFASGQDPFIIPRAPSRRRGRTLDELVSVASMHASVDGGEFLSVCCAWVT